MYYLDEWLLSAVLLAWVGGTTLVGIRLGSRLKSGPADEARSQISTLVAGMLGLLGLLLGFTFSMAAERFDARRLLVVDEANALGTMVLRAQLLPEPARSRSLQLARAYVDADVDFYNVGVSLEGLQGVDMRMRHLQDSLWSMAVEVAALDPRSVVTGLYLQSLNQAIDLHGQRVGALANHIPQPVLWVEAVVAGLTSALLGFGSGLGPRRDRIPALLAGVMIVLVVVMIVDMGRPRQGLIHSGQASLLLLQKSLKEIGDAPSSP